MENDKAIIVYLEANKTGRGSGITDFFHGASKIVFRTDNRLGEKGRYIY